MKDRSTTDKKQDRKPAADSSRAKKSECGAVDRNAGPAPSEPGSKDTEADRKQVEHGERAHDDAQSERVDTERYDPRNWPEPGKPV